MLRVYENGDVLNLNADTPRLFLLYDLTSLTTACHILIDMTLMGLVMDRGDWLNNLIRSCLETGLR